MIAKELGVTVAAVYHQYNTKDEIIYAAADSELRRLEAVVDAAESEPTAGEARDALVAGMVDLSVGGAGGIGAVLSDPIVIGTFHRHDRFRDLIPRMRRLLMGDEASQEPRIRTATLIAALNGVATHPFVADLRRGHPPPRAPPGRPAPPAPASLDGRTALASLGSWTTVP